MIPLRDPDLLRRTTPHVTRALIAANVLVGLITLFTLSNLDETLTVYRYGAIPSELTGGVGLGLARFRDGASVVNVDLSSPIPTWATIFTAMFLHGGFLHLGGNMLFLWVFGDNIEDHFGHVRFLGFYLISGVIATWAQVLVDTSSQVPMIGASGAVAGVLGAYLVLHPRSRIDTLVIVGFIFHLRLPAFVLLGGWILMQFFLGGAALGAEGGGVAYFAHVGGFAAGAIAALGGLALKRGGKWPASEPPSPSGGPRRR